MACVSTAFSTAWRCREPIPRRRSDLRTTTATLPPRTCALPTSSPCRSAAYDASAIIARLENIASLISGSPISCCSRARSSYAAPTSCGRNGRISTSGTLDRKPPCRPLAPRSGIELRAHARPLEREHVDGRRDPRSAIHDHLVLVAEPRRQVAAEVSVGEIDGAGNVSRDRVDRLHFAPEPLRRPRVDNRHVRLPQARLHLLGRDGVVVPRPRDELLGVHVLLPAPQRPDPRVNAAPQHGGGVVPEVAEKPP